MGPRQVYATDAQGYQQLVAAEDVDENLPAALTEALDDVGTVVEIGAGTGRVTRLLRSAGIDVVATEPAEAMMAVADDLRGSDPGTHLCRAEAARLPLRAGVCDAAVAGWVFGHQREWAPMDWQTVITGFLAECDRVTGHGRVVIIETLGTGHDTPDPPAELVEYYSWLEESLGFTRRVIRTDYSFETVDEAAEVTGRFFGPEFAGTVRRNGWARVPECTGIWVRPSRP